jgi:hypothetical protein
MPVKGKIYLKEAAIVGEKDGKTFMSNTEIRCFDKFWKNKKMK